MSEEFVDWLISAILYWIGQMLIDVTPKFFGG